MTACLGVFFALFRALICIVVYVVTVRRFKRILLSGSAQLSSKKCTVWLFCDSLYTRYINNVF